ncbi:ZCHC3 protein, partial [Atractosteus spatula]|nr:ZCHC3 protein [Atractosteus spatula]
MDKKDEQFVRDFEVLGCYHDNFRVVIVHLYDPFLGDDDVTAFLLRHVSVIGQPERILDSRNVWAGKRKYRVKLRSDARGAGGFHHPPASFSLGASRAYLYYQNQPKFCRRCRGFGHQAAECRGNECVVCGAFGHVARECRKKVCTLCETEGHLFKNC